MSEPKKFSRLCTFKLLDLFVKVLKEETSFWIVFYEFYSLWSKLLDLFVKVLEEEKKKDHLHFS